MKIHLSTASPDSLSRDTLILGFFSDERPPRGFCGRVDWRLNGVISTAMARGRVSGDFLEKTLYAFPDRIRVSRLLLLGMGAISELTYDRLYNAGFEAARTISGIQASDLAMPMPAAGRGPLELPQMTEALVTGIFDGFSRKPAELPSLALEIPAREEHAEGILTGLDLFRRHAGTGECEIRLPEERADPGPSSPGDLANLKQRESGQT